MPHALDYGAALSVEQFLAWPGDGLHRLHALIEGVPVAMNPPALAHSLIMSELAGLLGNHLRATRPGCRVMIEPGVRPRAGAARDVRIPDLAVACPPRGQLVLENPLVLIEILSPGNAAETREAVRACLTIAGLREVLVIDSVAIGGEHLMREPDGAWPEDPAPLGPADDIVFETLGFARRSPPSTTAPASAWAPDPVLRNAAPGRTRPGE